MHKKSHRNAFQGLEMWKRGLKYCARCSDGVLSPKTQAPANPLQTKTRKSSNKENKM